MGAIHQMVPVKRSAVGAIGPIGVPDLEFWLDATQETGYITEDEISTGLDWSGNARNVTGVVHNTLKPTYRATDGPNGLPCFRMSLTVTAQGGYFQLPDFFTGITAGHALSIVRLDVEPSLNARAAPPLGDWGSSFLGEFYTFPADNGIYDGFGSTVRKTTGNPDADLTAWHVYEERTVAGAWSRRINGATSGNDFFSTATNTVGWSGNAKIGGRISSDTAMLYGLIAEVIFFSRVLDPLEMQAIYDYIEDKTNILMP